ncbi:unnamed protein product [Orchesella dallaii]|uniref:Odorant receptor n=1 Tax=Orchesella dallaii TaxID=48710 RepID=A0ABP1RF58_9HEXA
MSSPVLDFSLKLHEFLNRYWYQHLIQFNTGKKKMPIVTTHASTKATFLTLTSILIMIIPCAIVSILEYFRQSGEIPLVVLFLYVAVTMVGIIEIILYLIILQHPEIAINIRWFMPFVESQFRETVQMNIKSFDTIDAAGIISATLTFGMILPVGVVPILSLVTDLDPYWPILAYYAPSISSSFYMRFLRACLSFIGTLEILRSSNNLFFYGLLPLSTCQRILKGLIVNIYREKSLISLYTQLQLTFKDVHSALMKSNCTALVGLYCVLSVTAWITVTWLNQFPLIISIQIMGILSVQSGMAFVFTTCCSNLSKNSWKLVANKRRLFYSKNRRGMWETFVMWKVWKARSHISVPYGIALEFNKNTPLEYFSSLSTNVVNMLLLF